MIVEMYMRARHEAGHAVVARHYGIGVEKVTIVPEERLGADNGGHCEFECRHREPDPHDAANHMVAILAGGVAHRMVCPRRDGCDIICDGSEQDREKVSKMHDPKVHQFTQCSRYAIAEKLVRRYREEIETVAEALCCKLTLTGKEVDELVPGFGACRCIVCQRGLRGEQARWYVHKDDVMAAVQAEWEGFSIVLAAEVPADRREKKTDNLDPAYYSLYDGREWKGWVMREGGWGMHDFRGTWWVTSDTAFQGQMKRKVLVETGETDTLDGKNLWIEHTIRREITRR